MQFYKLNAFFNSILYCGYKKKVYSTLVKYNTLVMAEKFDEDK